MSDEADMIRSLTLILDNTDAHRYYAIVNAAQQAIVDNMGSPGMDLDSYREAFKGNIDRDSCIRVVGMAVSELLSEWIDEDLKGNEWWRMIITDVLDLSSSGVQDALGEHYLPEPDDMADFLSE